MVVAALEERAGVEGKKRFSPSSYIYYSGGPTEIVLWEIVLWQIGTEILQELVEAE